MARTLILVKTTRTHDPRRLDVVAAAAEAAELSGRVPLASFERLRDDGAATDASVDWAARFESAPVHGGSPEVRLHLSARAAVPRECQRCLAPVLLDLAVDRPLRFARDEATAAALDAESEDDVLALTRRLDLLELVEDELLLALPLVPRHDTCPQPLVPGDAATPPTEAVERPQRPNPFAALAALKSGGGGGGS
jgi:uncharacterized protein